MSKIIEKEMGLTHREFYRLIYRLLPEARRKKIENGVVWTTGKKKINIRLMPEGKRKLSPSVSVPVTKIEIQTGGFSEEETQRFISDFDLCFRKGGG